MRRSALLNPCSVVMDFCWYYHVGLLVRLLSKRTLNSGFTIGLATGLSPSVADLIYAHADIFAVLRVYLFCCFWYLWCAGVAVRM